MNHHFENMQAWGVYGWAVQGGFTLSGVTLLAAAGMGLRCDFCDGTVLIEHSAVQPGAGRALSTTADGIHFMHHRGRVVLRNTTVAGTGDDCFNVHSNFFVMTNYSADRRTATCVPSPSLLPHAATRPDRPCAPHPPNALRGVPFNWQGKEVLWRQSL